MLEHLLIEREKRKDKMNKEKEEMTAVLISVLERIWYNLEGCIIWV